MKNNKNQKGFTLVELLVAISILGLIMVIAIPQISTIQTSNKNTKYKKYAESMVTSAKLYTDSYTEDMFGNNQSGCVDIPYKDMKDKDLIKDFKLDGATCNHTGKTFIRVRKANDHYLYQSSIYCTDKSGKVVYDKQLPTTGCDDKPDTKGPTMTIDAAPADWTKGVGVKATVRIWDEYGMLENIKIKLVWTKEGAEVGTPVEYNFKNKRYVASTASTALTYSIEVPQNATGQYILKAIPVDVRDSVGNYKTGNVMSGAFKLDNTKPRITGTTNSSNSEWTNQDVTITSSGEDDHSGIKQIYYYYTANDKLKDWNEDNKTTVKGIWTAERSNEVFVIAEDKVGNLSEPVSAGDVNIDKTKPRLLSTSNDSKSKWVNKNVIITATATDTGGSGLEGIYYHYDSDSTHRNDWDSGSTAASVTGTWSAERNNGIYIVVKDNAGNVSDSSSVGSIKIDKTKPVISSISNPKNNTPTVPGLKVTLTGGDSGTYQSGIAKWRYHYPNEDWKDISNSNKSPYEDTYTALRNATTVYYSLCDTAGNCSDASTTIVHIVSACSSTTTTWSGTWTTCTKKCGTGTQTQSGTKYSTYTGENCGTTSKSQNCETQACCSKVTYTDGDKCSADCGGGTKNRLAYSYYDGSRCSSNDTDTGGAACNTHTCGPPSHTHKTSLLGDVLHKCGYHLSCGTTHSTAHWGYCGVCYNYGKVYRSDTYSHCPGKNLDGCKWWNTSYPTSVKGY